MLGCPRLLWNSNPAYGVVVWRSVPPSLRSAVKWDKGIELHAVCTQEIRLAGLRSYQFQEEEIVIALLCLLKISPRATSKWNGKPFTSSTMGVPTSAICQPSSYRPKTLRAWAHRPSEQGSRGGPTPEKTCSQPGSEPLSQFLFSGSRLCWNCHLELKPLGLSGMEKTSLLPIPDVLNPPAPPPSPIHGLPRAQRRCWV